MNGREPLLGVADVPRTPFVEAGAVEAAGDVEEAGAVAAAAFLGLDECCALWTPLVAGVEREVLLFCFVELFAVELFVTELLVVELLVVELFTTELFVVLLLVTLVVVVTVVVLLDKPH